MTRGDKITFYWVIVTFILTLSVRTYAETINHAGYKNLSCVDSIKVYCPENEGVFSTASYTRNGMTNLIKECNLSGKTLKRPADYNKIERITECVNSANVSSVLAFDVSETILTTTIKPSLNKWLPGLHWHDTDNEAVKGCALIYIGEECLLIWFGLDFVDIYNLRLDCSIINLIEQYQ